MPHTTDTNKPTNASHSVMASKPYSHQTVFVAPFSHLDLFWAGTREECLSRGNTIISTALELLEQNQDFRFLIETVNFLDHYLSCYPEEEARIRSLVEEGRLELAPIWSAIYQNLPSGETLARNALYGKSYVRKRFENDPLTAHFADLPGYTAQYPQIAQQSGIKYILMSRGGPSDTPLFNWAAPDGTCLTTYYNSLGYAAMGYHQQWHLDFKTMQDGGTRKELEKLPAKDYPHLIHWGSDLFAPCQNIIDNVRQWNLETEPQLRLCTLEEYFKHVETRDDLPTLSGEVPSCWPNIEGSWPDLWPEDIRCENAMHLAEFLSTLCLQHGWKDYPQAELDQAWKDLLDAMDHNQNSQGGDWSDRDKLQLKQLSRYTAEQIALRKSWLLASQIKVPHAQSFPVLVFNSQSWKRSNTVIARVACFGMPRSIDADIFKAGMRLVDDRGETVPYVPINQHEGMSMTLEFAFKAEDTPALGYRVWYLEPGHNPIEEHTTCHVQLDTMTAGSDTEAPQQLDPRRCEGEDIYQNKFFKLSVDRITGDITILDLRTNEILFDKMAMVGVEERGGNYISNMEVSGRTFHNLVDSIDLLENNSVWCRFQVKGSIAGMPVVQTITLYPDCDEISIENEIDWKGERWLRMQQVFPYAGESSNTRYGVPYGQVTYPEAIAGLRTKMVDEIPLEDVEKLRLCQQWVDIGDESSGVTIASDHRMWEFEDKRLRSYMLRGIKHSLVVKRLPDGTADTFRRPPPGKYKFKYTLRPRNGSLTESHSYRCGWELNSPLHTTAVGGSKNTGTLPAQYSLIDLSHSSYIVTAVKKSESDNHVVIRAFEAAGIANQQPDLSFSGIQFHESNILEEERKPLSPCRPYEIKTWISE